MSEAEVRSIVAAHTEGRQFGFLGEPRVNVLELNLDLDNRKPMVLTGEKDRSRASNQSAKSNLDCGVNNF